MKTDAGFAGAVARSREANLINAEKFSRMINAESADEAFSLLKDFGFAKGEEATAGEYEKLIAHEKAEFAAFVKTYSPSAKFTAYLLLKNDFHNAEVALRAKMTGTSLPYLPDGLTAAEDIRAFADGGKANIPDYLSSIIATAAEESDGISVSTVFLKGYYAAAIKKTGGIFNELIRKEIDFKNVSAAIRCADANAFKKQFISGGKIKDGELIAIVEKNYAKARKIFAYTDNYEPVSLALSEAEKGEPLVEFERYVESYPLKKLSERKYEPTGITPFAVYCFYKENELKNVRVVMAGKLAMLGAEQIKRRMKDNYVG